MSIEFKVLLALNVLVCLTAIYFGFFVYPYREHTEETKRRERSWISNAYFRELWYFMMNPLKKKFLEWDVDPNTITIWGFVFSVLAAPAFAVGNWGLAAYLVIFASTCDVYDGMLARARNISRKSGAFFDSVLDRVGESAMFFGILWYFKDNLWWFVTMFFAFASSQVVSYARARAEGLGFASAGARGFFQRAERMIVLSLSTGFSIYLDFFWPGTGIYLVKAGLIVLAIGSVYTALARGFGIYAEIRKTEI